jgi:DNA-binding NtrC family response regulator
VRAEVPPLRERKDDLPMLANHFAAEMGRGFDLSPALVAQLARHDWPGNVRELRNVVERALSLGASSLEDLGGAAPAVAGAAASAGGAPDPAVLDLPFKEAKAALIEGFERAYLEHLLAKHKGNISRAAQEAGIDRNYIHRLVKKYDLEVERG